LAIILSKKTEDVFTIVCLQRSPRTPRLGDTEAEYKMAKDENLNAIIRMIDRTLSESRVYAPGFDRRIRLVVCPESAITSYPFDGQDAKEWVNRGSIYVPGDETDKLGEKAKEYGVYIVCNSYERNDDWSDAYFNTSFIMDPNGKILSKYRRLHTGVCVSPDELFDDYIKKYGWDGLFPVAKTKIGTLAALACGEIDYPEISRMFALQGAEILCHCDGYGMADVNLVAGNNPSFLAHPIHRRARAIENTCYVAMANHSLLGGGCEIIDYYGRILARTFFSGEQTISALVNMHSLRVRRATQRGYLFGLRTHIFAKGYDKYEIWPPNQFLKKMPKNVITAKGELYKKIFENCFKLGIIKREVAEAYGVPKETYKF